MKKGGTGLIPDAGNELIFNDPVINNDKDWLRNPFFVKPSSLHPEGLKAVLASKADRMFTDSGVGNSVEINPAYQHTRYADIPRKGRLSTNVDLNVDDPSPNLGNGRIFQDVFNNNSEILYVTLGVPKFNSLFTWLSASADYRKSIVANEGRSTALYTYAKVRGTIVGARVGAGIMFASKIASLWFWLGAAVMISPATSALFKVKSALLGNSDLSYYTLKPDMPNYFKAVSTIFTTMCVERGLAIPELMNTKENPDGKRIGMPIKLEQDMFNELHNILPNIFKKGNYIDIFALTQNGQVSRLEGPVPKKTNDLTFDSYVKKIFDNGLFKPADNRAHPENKKVPSINSQSNTREWKGIADKLLNVVGLRDSGAIKSNSSSIYKERTDLSGFENDMADYYWASVKGGGNSIAFRVEYVDTVTESFSNSSKNIPTEGYINSFGGAIHDAKFSMASGGDGIINKAKNAVKDVVTGAMDGFTMGLTNVLSALIGGGYMKMGKMWDNSTINLPEITYKINIKTPYANPISLALDLDIVIASLLAMMLPREIGRAGYTSPPLANVFVRGKQIMNKGMMSKLSITRKGFKSTGQATEVDITFSFVNFDTLMTSPVSTDIFSAFELSLDEGNGLNNYIATLAGRDYHTSKYVWPKALMRRSKLNSDIKRITSGSYWGMMEGNSPIGFIESIFNPEQTPTYLQDDA